MIIEDGPEEPLLGGDVTEGVVRVGDTVRRPRQPGSDLVETLLTHLERVGFDGAPRFLGIEALGIPESAWASERPDPPGTPPSIAGPPSFVGHMDITPENVVFRDGHAAALIDFDLARPTDRLGEVCNMLRWWAAGTTVGAPPASVRLPSQEKGIPRWTTRRGPSWSSSRGSEPASWRSSRGSTPKP